MVESPRVEGVLREVLPAHQLLIAAVQLDQVARLEQPHRRLGALGVLDALAELAELVVGVDGLGGRLALRAGNRWRARRRALRRRRLACAAPHTFGLLS